MVDMHCHLFAGLDDGPRDDQEALEMCQMLLQEQVISVVAVAHQNEWWPNKAETIRQAGSRLIAQLQHKGLDLRVFPSGEVMLRPDIVDVWQKGELLSIGNAGRYILIEFPHGVYVDLRPIVQRLQGLGLRPILAHAERCPQLLYGNGAVEELIAAGCLIQVNADSLTNAPRDHVRAVKQWFKRNIVHFLGSDGHSPQRRPPLLAEAYQQITSWLGAAAAERICHHNGHQVLSGLELEIPEPTPPRKRWFARFFS